MTGPIARHMILVLLFSAAVRDASPEQRDALTEVKDMLRTAAPLSEIAERVFDVMGPEWVPPEDYMRHMRSLGGEA